MALSNNNWFVVMTKPKMELEARDNLQRQDYEVYLPIWRALKQRRGQWTQVESPMFPRYLFLRNSYADQSLAQIRSTRGVSQLVRFGVQPAVASDQLIHDIAKLETLRHHTTGTLVPFHKGETVEVLDGPFKGISAEVLECNQQRVILLLQVLGTAQRLEFDTARCRAT